MTIVIRYSSWLLFALLLFLVLPVIRNHALAEGTWQVIDSPNSTRSATLNNIQGMANTSAKDLWAVGVSFDSNGNLPPQALIEHSTDGHTWTVVLDSGTGSSSALQSIVAVSPTNIYAVGWIRRDSVFDNPQVLIEHYNGTSWTDIGNPSDMAVSPFSDGATLSGISKVSESNIWAVGTYGGSGFNDDLVLHYDGTNWNVQKFICTGTNTPPGCNDSTNKVVQPLGVSATSSNNVWYAGIEKNGGDGIAAMKHWDGSGWSESNAGSGNQFIGSQMTGVVAQSDGTAWGSGEYFPSGSAGALIMRTSSSGSLSIPSSVPSTAGQLNAITAVSKTELWAVGQQGGSAQTLAMHYDGANWKVITSANHNPSSGTYANRLHAVTAVSSFDVWAGGDYNSGANTLIEQYGPKVYRQTDSAWGNDTLGINCTSSTPNLYSLGCVVTAAANVFYSYGYTNIVLASGSTDLTAGTLNSWMREASHKSFSGCSTLFPNVSLAANLGCPDNFWIYNRSDNRATAQTKIDTALAAGNLPIVGICLTGWSAGRCVDDNTHFVVLSTKLPDLSNGSPDYLIDDPALYSGLPDRNGQPLSTSYGWDKVFQVIVFDKATAGKPCPNAVGITAHSPIQLLVTDPNGLQTGYQATTSAYLTNIPHASYGVEAGIADMSGQNASGPASLNYEQSEPIDGTYVLQAYGTGNGSYSIDFTGVTASGSATRTTVSGTAVTGKTDTYHVLVSSTAIPGSETVVATLMPQTSISLSPSASSDGTFSNPVTVTLTSTASAGFNVAHTYYTLDGGAQATYSAAFTVSGAGSHTIVYWSVDNVGLVEADNTKTFTISTSSSTQTLGFTSQGTTLDDTNQNYMNGSQFTMGNTGGTVQSISAYVGAIDSSPHNQYQLAIYTDDNGSPGALVAHTNTGTLTANTWNTLSISATLSANTPYWLMYNTNSTNDNLNNIYYSTGEYGHGAFAQETFGTVPNTFPSSPTYGSWKFSMYVTYTPTTPYILGFPTLAAVLDDTNQNYMNGTKFRTGTQGGTASSMSVYVGSVESSPHNSYQMGIYTDNNGSPGTKVANTATGTLTANSWNTLSITATLSANTNYWLMYNTNSTTNNHNNIYYSDGETNQGAYAQQTFGTYPTTYPSYPSYGSWMFSIYVSYL